MTTIRELKKDALIRLSGNYLKILFMYLIYGIIVFAFSCLANFIDFSILKLIYAIILLVFSVPFSYGVIYCIMDIIRGKKSSLTEFINVGLKNIKRTWGIYLRIIFKLIVPIVLFIASSFFMLLTLAASVFGSSLANYFILSAALFVFTLLLLLVLTIYYSFAFR